MSSTISRITAKALKADLNGQSVEVRLAAFLCMNSGFFENSERDKAISRGERQYAQSRPANFFIEAGIAPVKINRELEGRVVFRMPNGYLGSHSDYYRDEFEIVGTLVVDEMGSSKFGFRIETDAQAVEQMRREREFEQMSEGTCFIGGFGNDVDAYKASLEERDYESTSGMATRGHGF